MQAGFGMVEAGFIRAKNTCYILTKNFLDFCMASLGFFLIGYGLMFGDGNSFCGVKGWCLFGLESTKNGIPLYAFWLFQAAFCGAAATIVAGGMAERMKFPAYLIYSFIISALIYPIVGHWIWGGGWLGKMGFADFAGSTVVLFPVTGLNFMHAAANWAPPVLELQTGAVGTRMGKCWIIENCTVTNARCVGIILGHAPGVDYDDIDAYVDHIIRNNIIRRFGQAGIAGQKGATRSVISGNLIEDTNYRREFGGWETAAIKFHNSVDTIIRGNLIRGMFRQIQGAFGIWIDYANQGIRITGNVIYNTEAANVFLEMNHGPILVDNNILVGQPTRSNSEATVFAHNLYVDCGYEYSPDIQRRSQFYKPHTTQGVGSKTGTAQDDKWFNNIFIRQGLDQVKTASGYTSDYNVFLEGAKRSTFGDDNSIVDSYVTDFIIKDHSLGTTITFSINDTPFSLNGPQVNSELVVVFPTVGQTIEDRYGHPIKVDIDINGRKYSQPIAGPLADLKRGLNTVVWSGKQR
jgi:hypothetical protein